MDVLLQINEIVSGPIKDLLVDISGGNFPDIKLPNISLPEVSLPELPPMSSPTYPEEVNLEVGGSSFEDLGSSELLNNNGSSELLTETGSSELLNNNGSSELLTETGSSELFNGTGSSDFFNENGSSELLNDFQSSKLDLSALGSILGG